MFHVFNVIPTGFFNNLASGSNQRIYSDCIQLISLLTACTMFSTNLGP